MSTVTTPNMNLVLPVPTIEPGPDYATEINSAFDTIDAHTHVSGDGVQIPTAGININADFPMNDYDLTEVRTVRFTSQSASLVESADIGCIYNVGGNMYWNNASGTAIQITAGSSLNAASIGGIGGDYISSGASMYYTSISATYFLTSTTNTPANLSAATIKIAEATTSPNTISLKSPSSLAASYNVTFPAAVPASNRVVVMSSAGTLSVATGGVATDDIADSAVTTAKIADLNVTTGKIAANAVTRAKLSALGNLSSAGTGAALSVTGTTITTFCTRTFTGTGRPIALIFQGDSDAAQNPYVNVYNGSGATAAGYIYFYRDSTILAKYSIGASAGGSSTGSVTLPSSAFNYVDVGASSTPCTYYIKAAGATASDVVTANYSVLLAYEL